MGCVWGAKRLGGVQRNSTTKGTRLASGISGGKKVQRGLVTPGEEGGIGDLDDSGINFSNIWTQNVDLHCVKRTL